MSSFKNYKTLAVALLAVVGINFTTLAQDFQEPIPEEVKSIFDSAMFYRLKSPQLAINFGSLFLDFFTETKYAGLRYEMLSTVANAYKMQGNVDKALEYINQVYDLPEFIISDCILAEIYYFKGTIYSKYLILDSLTKYGNLILSTNCEKSNHHRGYAYRFLAIVQHELKHFDLEEKYLLEGYPYLKGQPDELYILEKIIRFYKQHDSTKIGPWLNRFLELDYYTNMDPNKFLQNFASIFDLNNNSNIVNFDKLLMMYANVLKTSSGSTQATMALIIADLYLARNLFKKAEEIIIPYTKMKIEDVSLNKMQLIYHKLAILYQKQSKFKEALYYFNESEQLLHEKLNAETQARISELNIKYETLRKKGEIDQQNQAILKNRDRLIAITGFAVLIVGIAFVGIIYYRQRLKNHQDYQARAIKLQQEETNRLKHAAAIAEITAAVKAQEFLRQRVARNLHDDLSAVLHSTQSQYISLIDGAPSFSKYEVGKYRQKFQSLNQELRSINYVLHPIKVVQEGLEAACRSMCISLLNSNGIETDFECNVSHHSLSQQESISVFRILQYLMTSALKNNNVRKLFIQIQTYSNECVVIWEEIILNDDTLHEDQNLDVTIHRIQNLVHSLTGTMDLDRNLKEGTTITINFPLSSIHAS